jgi:pilus assembly protein CpaB
MLPYSATLLQNVRVLAVDQNIDRARQAKPARAVTLEVSLEQAQKLTLAASVGQLSLALRKAGSAELAEIKLSGVSDLPFQASIPAALVEPAKVEAKVATVKVESANQEIGVTRGTDRTVYEVLVDGATELHRVATIKRAQAAEPPSGLALTATETRPSRDAGSKSASEDDEPETAEPR